MKITKKELEQEFNATRRRLHATEIALACAINGEKPQAITKCKIGDVPTDFRVYKRWAAHGGVIVYTVRIKGQKPLHTAEFFESWANRVESMGHHTQGCTDTKIVLEGLIRQLAANCP